MSLGSPRPHSRPRLDFTRGLQNRGPLLHAPVRLIRSLLLAHPSGFVYVARLPPAPLPPPPRLHARPAEPRAFASRAGSIDSLAPARSPFGLRLCRSAPPGPTPAPASTSRAACRTAGLCFTRRFD